MKKRKAEQDPVSDAEQQHQEEEDVSAEQQQHDASVNGTRHKLQPDKLRLHKEQTERKGIVYISRIPPHMKPAKLRHLLEKHGCVTRLYCAPEDTALRAKRKRSNKDTGKRFTEGWVEFEDKTVAKRVAAVLNGTPMGGRRRDAYHYDLWCLKYLKKFKWDHLTEEIAYERAVREQRMAAELRAAKKERDFYLQQVGQAKALDAIQQRNQAKEEGGQPVEKPMEVKRRYGQRAVKADPASSGAPVLDDGLLSLVAGG